MVLIQQYLHTATISDLALTLNVPLKVNQAIVSY
jgi:hypothetical protein